ncbi:MAG: hypothetical protein ABI045_02745 [Flavobacteriales bacterium]
MKVYELLLAIVVVLCLITILYSRGQEYIQSIDFGVLAAFLSAFLNMLNVIFLRKNSPHIIIFYEMLGSVEFITLYLLMQVEIDAIVNIGTKDFFWVLLLGTVLTAY